jgi:hypothetical protein
MVFDLFTLTGLFLFIAMLAALLASHDFGHDASAEQAVSERTPRPRNR